MILFAALLFDASFVQAAGLSKYTGVQSCKLCHQEKAKGDQYGQWKKSAHARAYQTLLTPKAKEFAQKRGIAQPEKSPECLQCHSTAYEFSTKRVAINLKDEDGVQCESCHGAGRKYEKKEIMKDHQRSIDAGLIIPTEELCIKCHNAQSPTWDPVKGFNFKEAIEKVKHPNPKKKAK